MAEAADINMGAHEEQKIGNNNGLQSQSTVCFICQGNDYKRDCPNLRPQNTAAMVHKGWHHNSNMRPQSKRPYNNNSFKSERPNAVRKSLSACCLTDKNAVKRKCDNE
jgi:hypothetical protein